uniref:Aminoglycoside phosphotransferase n=1 Tax=Geobacter sp. (strain M21) TaxID=443144 RepID=C6E5N4_GEOSM
MVRRLIKSLLEAKAYPEPTAGVRLIETHVSFIFVTDCLVYKVKKPVDYGFLDFTTLERRRFYCEEEVRLNRRLCPDLYLGVVELRRIPSGASFAGGGEILDYAVKMKRLPEERMLAHLLERGEAGIGDMNRIARVVADFHAKAGRSAKIDDCGQTAVIRRNWEENFRQATPFAGVTVSACELADIRRWTERFLEQNEGQFRRRVAKGYIRECDGDLHSGNICLTEKVCIFDCIEFNERFRYIDTAADLSFLLMDLEYAGRPDLSEALLAAYQKETEDLEMGDLLSFYKVYRAFVRGKVTSFLLNDPDLPSPEFAGKRETARRYFRLALGYTLRDRLKPSLVITCGLMGSGKSTLARELALELGFELRRSDVLRKEVAGLPLQPVAEEYRGGIYNEEMDRATYAALLAEAEEALKAGKGVVADATFRRAADREAFRALAAQLGVSCYTVETRCPELITRQRLEARSGNANEVSDARWEHFHRQQAEFEAPQAGESIPVDSTLPLSTEADLVLRAMGLLP